jgi:hypothetical protein
LHEYTNGRSYEVFLLSYVGESVYPEFGSTTEGATVKPVAGTDQAALIMGPTEQDMADGGVSNERERKHTGKEDKYYVDANKRGFVC